MARSRKRSVVSIDQAGRRARVLARRDRLVEQHLDLVPPIAKRVFRCLPPSFDLEDLIATGNLALTRAATVYKPERHGGCPFSAFARHRIRGAMLDSIRRRHYTENTRPSIDEPAVGLFGHHDELEGIRTNTRSPGLISEPTIESDLDRADLLKRLETAVRQLTDEQKSILDHYYAEDCDRLKRAHWRRRKEVIQTHLDILAILRAELAS